MDLKQLLYKKEIKQVDLAKELPMDPSRVSLIVRGVRPLPEKYHVKFCKILGITMEQFQAFKTNGGAL